MVQKQTISLNAYLQKKDVTEKPKVPVVQRRNRTPISHRHHSLQAPRKIDLTNKDPSNYVLDRVWDKLSQYGGLDVIQKCHDRVPSRHSHQHSKERPMRGFTKISYNQPIESQLANNFHFDNPYSTWHMVRSYKIDQHISLFPQRDFLKEHHFTAMREIQNKEYASQQYEKARGYFEKKQMDKGLKTLHETLKFDPSHPMAITQRAELYINDGNYKEALSLVAKALSGSPTNATLQALEQSIKKRYNTTPDGKKAGKKRTRQHNGVEEKGPTKKQRKNRVRSPVDSISPPIYTPEPIPSK